jgi:signal peptidase I
VNDRNLGETCAGEVPPRLQVRPVPPIAASSRAYQALETTQTVLTALTLAFIFRAFLVEAFIIPTGSMAHSLLGAHATRTCPACGWEYDFAPAIDCFCPNCHLRMPLPAEQAGAGAGDRILVHKWPYVLGGFLGPQRWEVIVFHNPADPSENYIKRLVGLPGETVEIVDGDLFINGRIARKTPAAQSSLWFVVFDQNYSPQANASSVAGPRWVAESPAADPGVGWSGLDTRVIRYRGLDDQERSIRFRPSGDRQYFQDVYAYNRGPSRPEPPYVGDMRILAEVTFHAGNGACRWELTRDADCFLAEVQRDGTVSLTLASRHAPGVEVRKGPVSLPPFRYERPYVIELGHVDYRVHLSVDGQEVLGTAEADYAPDLGALRRYRRADPVGLRIEVAGLELDLRGLRVDRDVYYTQREGSSQRAYAGQPFQLKDDEYFVLGDNSPDSRDSREWTERGPNLPEGYQPGTVRAEQIVGQAAFVYLPGLLPSVAGGRLALPDLGRMRFIR